jgi:hypothetical protein
MGKIKKGKIAGRILKGVAGATPVGRALKIGGAVLKGAGMMSGRSARRRSRGLNLMKYQKKLIKAKMDAKIMKVKMSAFKGI